MLQTYEAVLEPDAHLHFLEQAPTPARGGSRVLVTLIEPGEPSDSALCGARLSEPALAEDWLNPAKTTGASCSPPMPACFNALLLI